MAALFDVLLRGVRDTGLFATPEGVAAALSAARWKSRAIGERFAIQTHLVGAETPPNVEGGPRFIKLTAADAYNDGLLSDETVTGTAPDITATAVIALASSPLYGQTIHLANTERLFFRAGKSGVIERDAIRNITGWARGMSNNPMGSGAFTPGPTYSGNGQNPQQNFELYFDASRVVPTAEENRPRSYGITYYMRIF